MKEKIIKAINDFFVPWKMGEGMCVNLTTEDILSVILKVVPPDLVKVPILPKGDEEVIIENPGYETYKVYPTSEDVAEALHELAYEQKLNYDYSSGCSLLWQLRMKAKPIFQNTITA